MISLSLACGRAGILPNDSDCRKSLPRFNNVLKRCFGFGGVGLDSSLSDSESKSKNDSMMGSSRRTCFDVLEGEWFEKCTDALQHDVGDEYCAALSAL